jgi:hypothetical protein
MGAREQYIEAMGKLNDEQDELDKDLALFDEKQNIGRYKDHPDKWSRPLIGSISLKERQKSIDRRRAKIVELQTKLARRGSSWRMGRDNKQANVTYLEKELRDFTALRQQSMDLVEAGSRLGDRISNITELTRTIDRKRKQLEVAVIALQRHLDNKPPNIYAQLPEELAGLEHIDVNSKPVVDYTGPAAMEELTKQAIMWKNNPDILHEQKPKVHDTDVSGILMHKSDERMPDIQMGCSDEDDEFVPFDLSNSEEDNDGDKGE